MNKIELDKAIVLTSFNDKGKKEIMKFFFCHSRIHEAIKRQGAIDEIKLFIALVGKQIKCERARMNDKSLEQNREQSMGHIWACQEIIEEFEKRLSELVGGKT